jgi:hypothetical protein
MVRALADAASLRRGAGASDGVIHLAFDNISQTTDFAASCHADRFAIEALGEVLAGSGRPLVVTSDLSVPVRSVPGTRAELTSASWPASSPWTARLPAR